ncbi:hypothetical protein [Tenacibaculum sp. M341]|uniref:hypothetical protein n=1 Tax=Tenacibaculum sp. M341 TaxID=2530339 RepID=UPI00104B7E9E|nr:hypothetical protein [Tenacibaculum sp. M341]TCI90608.1 hypothetical protein EYW44_12840 [Tenacibaculum sp. M341]
MNRILPILGIIILINCKSSKIDLESKLRRKNDSINLFAFIGEKISLTEFDPNENNARIEIDSITGDTIEHITFSMDLGFKAKYKVLKNIFNNLNKDTIEFITYDHYGRPKFEDHKNIILYISKDKNEKEYYHQKYQFDPLIIDEDGTWEGLDGESLEELFNKKKNGVFKARGLFN